MDVTTAPLPIAAINDAISQLVGLPPAPALYSTTLVPSDKGFIFDRDTGQNVTIAHPDFWQQIPPASLQMVNFTVFGNATFGIQVIDLDADDREELRAAVMKEMAVEMMKGEDLETG